MQASLFAFLGQPADQFRHAAGRVEGCRGLEHDRDRPAVRVEGGDAVGRCLVVAAMPGVLLAMDQEIAVQLLDVVLGDGDVLPGAEDKLHDLAVSGDFLLVAGGERLDFEIGEQPLDLPVGKLAAFDAGGGADAFDGGDPSQRRQPFGGERAERALGALELVDFGDQPEDFGRDLEPVGIEEVEAHTQIYTHLHPNMHPNGPNIDNQGGPRNFGQVDKW